MTTTGVALLTLAIWVYLLTLRGGFWRADQRLPESPLLPLTLPLAVPVTAVIPARDEEAVLGRALAALVAQDLPGLRIVVVDDHSRDGTRAIADAAAAASRGRITVTGTDPLPPGWTGKLWALAEGVRVAAAVAPETEYLLFTDADIALGPGTLARLLAKAEAEGLDLVSLMVRLDDGGLWGRLLMPAFVFFFQKLYPFPWVNDPAKPTAGAAGGCVLLRRSALERAGGVAAIRGALIDDCSLAAAVKRQGGRLWLGLAESSVSLRGNGGLPGIWAMVARTAFAQLRHSAVLLTGAVAGMALTYLAAPLLVLSWPLHRDATAAVAGLATWWLMTVAYWPTLRLYRRPAAEGLLLPAVAALYSLMTVSSALDHWRGRGGRWKGRVYPAGG